MASTPVLDDKGPDSPDESDRPENGNASRSDHTSVQIEGAQGLPQDGPANDDNTEPGGETPKDKRTFRCTWKVLWTVLLVCLSLLLYRFFSDHGFVRTELQQKMADVSTAWENTECVKEDNRHLKRMQNTNLDINASNSAVIRGLRLLLQEKQQKFTRFKEADEFIGSIRVLDRLAFIWGFCDEATLQCSRCQHGWKEHDSRCFRLFEQENEWWAAQLACRSFWGNLAVVPDQKVQTFLTIMVEEYVQQHPNSNFHSAWIGLTDFAREGKYEWIDGRPMKQHVNYFVQRHRMTREEVVKDCIAIIPLNGSGQDPLQNWSSQDCLQPRNSICETETLHLPSIV